MTTSFVSTRIPSANAAFEAFTDQTYELLARFRTMFEQETHHAFEGDSFILLASDFLLHEYREQASWQLFGPQRFELFVLRRLPPLQPMRIAIAATLALFFRFLESEAVVDEQASMRVQLYARNLIAREAS